MANPRFIEMTIENYSDGSRFLLNFDLDDGPERSALIELIANRPIGMEAQPDGSLRLYSKEVD